ncbi:hypothetical protein BGW80DRAFT_1420370, partial [Lactifluus volemus]
MDLTLFFFVLMFSNPFGIFISLYIKAPMLPRPPSMFPQMIMTLFFTTHRRTHCAISRVITLTAQLARLLILSRPLYPLPILPMLF